MLTKASSYPDNETLLECVNQALTHDEGAIRSWLATPTPQRLVIDGDAGRPVGVVTYSDGESETSPLYRVVLAKHPVPPDGWTLQTSFLRRPEARPGFAVLDTPLAHLIGAYLNEDVDDYDAWQEALGEMSWHAPELYAALPGEIDTVLQRDDAALERLLCSLDFGLSTEHVPARELLAMVRQQLATVGAAQAALGG